jgi:4-aminobutyrate aminotransferase-like enzyme
MHSREWPSLFEKGGYSNRFQLIPALVMEKELIDRAVGILDRAMSMAEARSASSYSTGISP